MSYARFGVGTDVNAAIFYKVGSKFVAWDEEDEPSEETSKDSVGGGDCGEVVDG